MRFNLTTPFGGLLLAPFDASNSTRGFWRNKIWKQMQLNIPFLCYIRWQGKTPEVTFSGWNLSFNE